MSRFILYLSVIVFMGCADHSHSKVNRVEAKKIKLKLHSDVPNGSWFKIDDVVIEHSLPDTSELVNPFEFEMMNIRSSEDYNKFLISPSISYVPKSDTSWGLHRIGRGDIISGWIKCFALRKNLKPKDEYILDMPYYFAFEGIFIIERTDGEELSLEYSTDLPIAVEIIE